MNLPAALHSLAAVFLPDSFDPPNKPTRIQAVYVPGWIVAGEGNVNISIRDDEDGTWTQVKLNNQYTGIAFDMNAL